VSDEVWLHPYQAAERAGVSAITVRNWTETRGLVFRRIDSRGHRQYLASSLDAILARKGMPAGGVTPGADPHADV
jgi:DNA-binding transcriptional MerR regulator